MANRPKRDPSFTNAADLGGIELAAISSALTFANLPRVQRGSQVYALFDPLGPVLRLSETDEAQGPIFEVDRATVASRLRAAVASLRQAREHQLPGITRELMRTGVRWALVAEWNGSRLGYRATIYAPGVEARCFLALALLFDPSRPYGAMLRLCALDGCDNFFLAQGSARGGRKPRYCCKQHSREADDLAAVARMAEVRKAARHKKN